jgi:hypothetical protein
MDGDLTFVGAQSILTTADNLTLAPAADLVLTPGGTARVMTTTGVRIQSDDYVSQTTGWGVSYAGGGDFRYLYADEMHAKSFIADLEQALAGGQIISKSVAPLWQAFIAPAPGQPAPGGVYVEAFKGFDGFHVFADGDIVLIRQFSRTGTSLNIANCWGTVTFSSEDTDAHWQAYNFYRSAAPNAGTMATDTVIGAGTLVLDFGTTGNGYLESNAIDGAMAEYAPYHQIVSWTTHPNSGKVVRTRLGNLKGIFNVANEYGLYAGAGILDASQYLRISDQAAELHNISLKMFDGAVNTVLISPTAPSFAMGSTLPTAYGTGTGIWMGKDTAYKFRVGDPAGTRLQWTGTALEIYDAKFTMSGASSAIAIGTTPPTSASAGTGIWIDRTGMYGLAANVVQAKFDAATGAITAGAGNTILNSSGVFIKTTTDFTWTNINAYNFIRPDNTLVGRLYATYYAATGEQQVGIDVPATSGTISQLVLQANSPTTKQAWVSLGAKSGSTAIQITGVVDDDTGTPYWQIDGASLTIYEHGLNVGSATGAGPGCISVSGVAALTTPAESWVGPSATAIHFQGGLISIGTITAYANASLTLLGGGAGGVTVAFSNAAVALPGGLSLKTGYGVGYLACQNAAGNAGAPLYSQSMNLFYSRAAGVVHFDDPSDATLKKNIKSLPSGALSKINALKPRMYQMRAGANHHRKDDHTRQLTGWIADEFEQVFPDAVSHDDVGNFKSLNTSCIHEWTVAAIQELSAKVDVLEARAKSKVS